MRRPGPVSHHRRSGLPARGRPSIDPVAETVCYLEIEGGSRLREAAVPLFKPRRRVGIPELGTLIVVALT